MEFPLMLTTCFAVVHQSVVSAHRGAVAVQTPSTCGQINDDSRCCSGRKGPYPDLIRCQNKRMLVCVRWYGWCSRQCAQGSRKWCTPHNIVTGRPFPCDASQADGGVQDCIEQNVGFDYKLDVSTGQRIPGQKHALCRQGDCCTNPRPSDPSWSGLCQNELIVGCGRATGKCWRQCGYATEDWCWPLVSATGNNAIDCDVTDEDGGHWRCVEKMTGFKSCDGRSCGLGRGLLEFGQGAPIKMVQKGEKKLAPNYLIVRVKQPAKLH